MWKASISNMAQEKIATSKEEWWELIRKELASFNLNKHPDDKLSLIDFVSELGGSKIYGWIPYYSGTKGEWDIKTSQYEEEDEDSYDDYDDDEDYFTNESRDNHEKYVDEEDD